MSDQPESFSPPTPDKNQQAYYDSLNRSRQEAFQRFDVDHTANAVAWRINQEDTDSELGGDKVTYYLDNQISRHGGTELGGWEFGIVLGALGNRCLRNDWLRDNVTKIESTTQMEMLDISQKPILESALIKQGVFRYVDGELDGISPEMTDDEIKAYMRFNKNLRAIKSRCEACGDTGKVLYSWVERTEERVLLRSAMRDENLDEDNLEGLQSILDQTGWELIKVDAEVRAINLEMTDDDLQDERKVETNEWLTLLKGTIGASEVFSTTKQWLTNQSDLDPISKLWVYMGRMTEVHPSALEAMIKQWPDINEAFIGIAALGSGKYALADNGRMYISGRYGMGYIDSNGNLVDLDDHDKKDEKGMWVLDANGNRINVPGAVIRTPSGRERLKPGYIKLGLNQIFVSGAPNNGVVDVVNGVANINGENVRIFSENILYLNRTNVEDIRIENNGNKLKDRDIDNFFSNIAAFVKGRGGSNSDPEVDLAVELARGFYEFSMLANWNGVARDSIGRIYYMKDNDPLTMTSNPESDAVKFGRIAAGTDESSTYPYWNGGDWGKLTQTRSKQNVETFKGRKHGLYAIMPFLPENLVKPFISEGQIERIRRGEIGLDEVFGNMNANEHFKTYWLNIYKGCAVYDLISTFFIGEKDPTKAGEDFVKMLCNTRLLEGITKDDDLSLYWVDPNEAYRFRVNLVIGAIATVSNDFFYEEYMGVMAGSNKSGKVDTNISKIDIKQVEDTVDKNNVIVALRQLVDSRFIGGEDELKIILDRLKSYKEGKTGLGFSLEEFRVAFGNDREVSRRIWDARKARLEEYLARQKADGKKK